MTGHATFANNAGEYNSGDLETKSQERHNSNSAKATKYRRVVNFAVSIPQRCCATYGAAIWPRKVKTQSFPAIQLELEVAHVLVLVLQQEVSCVVREIEDVAVAHCP